LEVEVPQPLLGSRAMRKKTQNICVCGHIFLIWKVTWQRCIARLRDWFNGMVVCQSHSLSLDRQWQPWVELKKSHSYDASLSLNLSKTWLKNPLLLQ